MLVHWEIHFTWKQFLKVNLNLYFREKKIPKNTIPIHSNSNKAHFCRHGKLRQLLVETIEHLYRWLSSALNFLEKPVALTLCMLESAHFFRHDRFWQKLVETIEGLVRWLCIRRMRVKISISKISEWLTFQI